MTIVESIKCVLQQNNDGLTSKQIYDEIIRQGLYSFGAENPVGVVNAQLRRRCIGLDFPTAYPIKFFEIAGYEGKKIKFRLISTENTATIITAPKTTDISELLPEEKIKAALQEHLQNKFIQFDVYYCCALIGMAAGQIDEDTSELKDLVERYPVQYRDCKAQIAGLLVASEARRLGIDTQSSKLEQIMLQYLSNNDTLLSEDGIKTLNAYALKGYRLITDYPLFDKPTSREEFLDAFNVAMQFYEKKDS